MSDSTMQAPLSRHLSGAARFLDDWATRLTHRESHLATQQLFKTVFFGWLFLHTALLVPFHRDIWSPDAFMLQRPFIPSSAYDWIFYVSGHPALRSHYLFFVFAQLIVLALGMAGVAPRLMNVLACVTTLNVNNLSPVILDGGNNLSQLILVYMMFLNTSGRPFRSRFEPLQMTVAAVSNAAFFVCRFQVVIVYVCTAIFKLNGPLWQTGMALYYIFQGDAYTHPLLYHMVMRHPWVSLAGSYFTVATQALLPVLVWPVRTRPYVLTAAVLTHLGISFGMGLFTFGLVMCVMYTLFFTDSLSRTIAEWVSPYHRLMVTVDFRYARLQRAMRAIRRLDWFDAIYLNEADANEPLTAAPDSGRAASEGAAALFRVLVKLTVLLPLAPLIGALYYVGALGMAYDRLIAERTGERDLPAAPAATTQTGS